MAIYVGETVAVRGVATDPFTKEPLVDLTGSVYLYAPGKDPKKVPDDRTPDAGPFAVVYDAEAGGYLATVPTAGLVGGKWTFKLQLTGVYDGWEYGSFKLEP